MNINVIQGMLSEWRNRAVTTNKKSDKFCHIFSDLEVKSFFGIGSYHLQQSITKRMCKQIQ